MYEIIARSRVLKIDDYEMIYDFNHSESLDFFSKEQFNHYNKSCEVFLIIYQKKLLGAFTLKDDSFKLKDNVQPCVKIDYFYICKKYRTYGLGTLILNDILWVVKRFRTHVKYVLADSLIDSCMFYLKKGFDYYASRKSDDGDYNIITLYKKIR